MKRSICAVVAAALLAPVLLTGIARAEGDDDAAPEQSEQPHAVPPADHPEPPRKGDGMGPRIAKRLGLTDEQAAKLRDAMKAHGEAMKENGRQAKDAVKKLADEVKAKASDEAILAALASLKAARKAMTDENEKLETNLASFLTPTQRAKMALGMARMMNRRREGMKEDGPRHRPGNHDVDGGNEHDGPPGDGE